MADTKAIGVLSLTRNKHLERAAFYAVVTFAFALFAPLSARARSRLDRFPKPISPSQEQLSVPTRTPTFKCLDCHTEIAGRLNAKHGYHARLGMQNPRERLRALPFGAQWRGFRAHSLGAIFKGSLITSRPGMHSKASFIAAKDEQVGNGMPPRLRCSKDRFPMYLAEVRPEHRSFRLWKCPQCEKSFTNLDSSQAKGIT